ncbi:MAG TPA: EAL domain-containing protein [Jatrophihabitans sp.]|nr:EAL domain-containing protein [Jatrophihabitans sp.]
MPVARQDSGPADSTAMPTSVPVPAQVTVPPLHSLQYLNGLMRHAGGVMYVRDATHARFLMVNPAFEELVGLPASKIIGLTGHELFPHHIAEEHRRNDELVLADGVARTSTEWAPGPDGSLRKYVSHKFPLLDPSGKPYAIGGISTDITELAKSESDRHDSEARFRAVFEHAPIGQIFSELGGGVSAVNEALASMLGYRPEEMIGHTVRHFTDPDEFERVAEATRALLEGADTVTEIRRFLHRDGHLVPVRVTSSLLRDADGNPRWWVSMVLNLTEEERTRAELERAHSETVQAARRLTLLNAVAGAANDSTELDSAAQQILAAVCGHFGWSRAAVIKAGPLGWSLTTCWPHTEVGLTIAQLPLDLLTGPDTAELLILDRAQTAFGAAVILPLLVDAKVRYALVFQTDQSNVDADDVSLLRLIALESTRLVERQVAGELLAESELRFRSIFAGSPLPMALSVGHHQRLSAVNDAMCQLVGLSADELIGRPAAAIVHPDDAHLTEPAAAAALTASDGRHVFGLRLLHRAGHVIDTVVTLTWMAGQNGGPRNLLIQLEDVTARRIAEESLRRQAEEDPLTGLANRAYLNRLLHQHAVGRRSGSVLFIDLDGFKLINDSCGHEVGDEVLMEVAHRLRVTVRPTDTVARLGGDEFVVLCTGVDADRLAERVSTALDEAILTAAGPVRVTASIGIADGQIPMNDPTELLRRADTAMYRAKRLGKDRREFYDADLHRQAIARSRTETALRTALDDGRFTVHYQPIVNLAGGRIEGFEALVRLVDEAGALVSPEHFISVAEQSGLIVPMGSWVLRQACATLAELRRSLGLDLYMAVNVAASQVSRTDLIDTVTGALAEAGLPEPALSLELTESALLEADSRTLQQLNTLRASGVHIALDDFGTGYSSLTYLRTFPVSHLKIDRSFVSGVADSSGDLAIVRAIAGMAADLGLGCVAEGVETEQQRALVAELGVPSGQGYLFAKPVPGEQLYGLLQPFRRPA